MRDALEFIRQEGHKKVKERQAAMERGEDVPEDILSYLIKAAGDLGMFRHDHNDVITWKRYRVTGPLWVESLRCPLDSGRRVTIAHGFDVFFHLNRNEIWVKDEFRTDILYCSAALNKTRLTLWRHDMDRSTWSTHQGWIPLTKSQ